MKLHWYLSYILFQLLIPFTYSQSADPAFIRISTKQGLSQGHVNSILKDHKGFMWFATDGGLNKYDGYTFKIFKNKPGNSSSISNDIVYDVAEDKSNVIWVATGSSLDKYDYKKETFTHYRPGRDIAINDVLIDHRSRIWLGTTEGLFLFDKQNEKFKNYSYQAGVANGLSNNHIYHLIEDNAGIIWIATQDGLNSFNPGNGQFAVSRYDTTGKSTLQTNWVRSLYEDREGTIWVGTIGSGIASYNPLTQTFLHYKHDPLNTNSLAHNDVLSFTEDKDNNLWIGTENGGISIFNRKKNLFTTVVNNPTDPQSLSNNSVYTLYKDDIGSIWAGTWSNGANLLPAIGKKFKAVTQVPGNPNSLSNPSVLSIICDEANNVWIGTDGGGLNRFNLDTKLFSHFEHVPQKVGTIQNDFVITLTKAGPNLLAIGYHRGGLDLFNTNTGLVVKHITIVNQEDKKFEISVNCLFRDRDENLWVGTWGGGLKVYDSHFNKTEEYLHSSVNSNTINNDFINCITEDRDGNIWIGTEAGVNKLNTASKKFTWYQHSYDKEGISNNEVNQIFEDKKGRLWIASNGGLDLFDKKDEIITPFTMQEGLPSSSIQSIAEDNNGILWLSTANGIAAFNTTTKKSRNYNTEDGLQGQEFKNNCSFVNKDGYLFFGGTEGFNYFHPDKLKDNDFIPPVHITDLQIFNKSLRPGGKDSLLQNAIGETNKLTLSYRQSVLTFEFAALNFTYAEKNQYAYMLEGFDKDWIEAGTHRSATYTNLDAGDYTFRVKASNNDGIWNEKGTSLLFVITPPFWKTWWFISLVLTGIAGLVTAFYNYRVAQIKSQKAMLEQQVKIQTEALVQLNKEESKARIDAEKARIEADEANKKLVTTNQEMEQFAYVVSHDLKEPLRTTTSFITLLQKKYKGQLDAQADKYLHFITDASERMKVQINDLLEFSRLGNTAKLVAIDCNDMLNTVLLDIDVMVKENTALVSSNPLPVISGYSTEIKLLFQNLLINAIKFRKKDVVPQINITAQDKGAYWEFAFKDNGIGIDPMFKDKIFVIFQRLHGAKEYEGTGIGLSHCQKIVTMHKGKIWLDSAVGEGCTFYFTLQKNLG